jgi:hypothetical protein
VKKTFLRAIAVNAALQFIATRAAAGRVAEEGAAEALWLRYPFVVVLNALAWTLLLTAAGGVWRSLRRA